MLDETTGSKKDSIKKSWSRRDFLRLSGVGLAGVALFGTAAPAFGQTTSPTPAPNLGIEPDNPNAAIQNRENLVNALRYSSTNVIFPPGDYYIDNSTAEPERGLHPSGYIVIDGYEGELTMESDARFVFTDNERSGLYFYTGTDAKFRGFTSAFQTAPANRLSTAGALTFDNTSDTMVEDTQIYGSPGAGVIFFKSIRPSVYGAVIKGTMADGLHFANCQNGKADDIFAENTGDDGLAFVNYNNEGDPDHSGGYATNITVKDGKGRGITVIGQSGVTIDGFTVDGTSFSGLMGAYDEFFNTRVPANALFMNGEVYNAGTVVDPAGKIGNHIGIEIDAVDSVEFRNIKVVSPADRGVTAVATREVSGTATEGMIRLTNIEVQDAPAGGFTLLGGTQYLDDLTVRDVGGRGVYVGNSELANYGKLTSINASKTDTLRRAFDFEHNARVEGGELHVVDNQASPTGYKISTYGTQSGTLGTVYDQVSNGNLVIDNFSGLDYTLGDATAPTVSAPTQSFVLESTLGASSAPVRISWSGSDSKSGIDRYELERSANGGAYSAVSLSSPTAASVTLSLTPGDSHRFRVRAVDKAGNASEWAEADGFDLNAYQESDGAIDYYRGVWRRSEVSSAYGDALKYANEAGDRALFTFTGREVAWISYNAPKRGKAQVYVDGTLEGAVDMYAANAQPRRVVFRRSWSAVGTHRINVKVVGTSGRPRVDMDAFLTIS